MEENSFRAGSVAFAEYLHNGSETAFAKVVEHCLPLVIGTAKRMSGGQRSLAEDVSQVVFADLARKASGVRAETLSSWLYRHTCFTTSKMMRSERRRIQREQSMVAGSQSYPDESAHEIDDLLQGLNPKDRETLFLRFVEGRSHGEVAEVLGTSSVAAQKRSERALERLRTSLSASLTGAGLLSALTAPVAESAQLVQTIAGASVAGTAVRCQYRRPCLLRRLQSDGA